MTDTYADNSIENAKIMTCPYCGHLYKDDGDIDFWPSEGEFIITSCYVCRNKFSVSRNASVSYTSRKLPHD